MVRRDSSPDVAESAALHLIASMTLYKVASALLLVIPAYLVYRRLVVSSTPPPAHAGTGADSAEKKDDEPKTIMQPPRSDLDPPKDDPYTLEQLKAFDGADASKPLYVSIKGLCSLCLPCGAMLLSVVGLFVQVPSSMSPRSARRTAQEAATTSLRGKTRHARWACRV